MLRVTEGDIANSKGVSKFIATLQTTKGLRIETVNFIGDSPNSV